MSRTKRTGSGKTAQRIVPLLVGAAVAVTSAILMSSDPASAASHSVTVSFTADGPTPAAVTLRPGDQVVYRNDVDPNSGTLLGAVASGVKSVAVDVENASDPGFTLKPGQSRALTYSQPVRATYTATYQPSTLLGLLPGRSMTTTGSLLVQAPAGETAPVAAPESSAASAGGGTKSPQSGSGQQAGSAQQGSAGSQTGQQAGQIGQAGPSVNYTPNAGDVAAGRVPQGGSAARVPDAPAGGPTDHSADVAPLPQLGAARSQPKDLDRASSDAAIGSLGLPALTAVVLLSMVSAGLVRTIMVRHASLA